jgi:hypothetical protein
MTAPSDRHVTLTELILGVLFVGAVAALGTEVIGWPRELALAHAGGTAVLIAVFFWLALKNSNASLSKRMGGLLLLAVLISVVTGAIANFVYQWRAHASYTAFSVVQLSRPDRTKYKGTMDELEKPAREFMDSMAAELTQEGFRIGRSEKWPVYQLELNDGSRLTIELKEITRGTPAGALESSANVFVHCDTQGWPSEQRSAKALTEMWTARVEAAWLRYIEKNPDPDLDVQLEKDALHIFHRPRPMFGN